MKNAPFRLLFLVTLISGFTACKKFLDIGDPPNEIVAATAFSGDQYAYSAMAGVYLQTAKAGYAQGSASISVACAMAADDLNLPFQNDNDFYRNVATGDNFWPQLYATIYQVNNIIEQLQQSASPLLSQGTRTRLTAEAKFLRAFHYFYLVNLYGDVPLLLSAKYFENAEQPRSPLNTVYDQIIKDLTEAKAELPETFVTWDGSQMTEERTRPVKYAAAALLARIYLYRGKYAEAITEANTVLSQTALFELEENPNETFLKNSREAIWQIQPKDPSTEWSNNQDALSFLRYDYNTGDTLGNCWMGKSLLASFGTNDARKKYWTGQGVDTAADVYPYKYKQFMNGSPQTEYIMALRLSEQYLIMAEALTAQGNVAAGTTYLNTLRRRAGLGDIHPGSAGELMTAILEERRVEFFTEWGHRWFDLKRLGNIDAVMKQAVIDKKTTWQPYRALFGIPYTDLEANEKLVQNPGYLSPR